MKLLFLLLLKIIIYRLNRFNNINSKYVYIKGNGDVYESKKDTNLIGTYVGKTSPTLSTGNHFGWEINFPTLNKTYYVDHLRGEIISTK